MILVWFIDEYYSLAILVIIMSFIIIFVNSINTYSSNQRILKFALNKETKVLRGFDIEDYLFDYQRKKTNLSIKKKEHQFNQSVYLVPGDVIELSNDDVLPSDCILLDGICTVNEADLTGESSLVMKSSLQKNDEFFNFYNSRKSFLFQGTKIEKCEATNENGKIKALVINTGFNTNRGNLILNILFSNEGSNWKFTFDNYMYFIIMLILYLSFIIPCIVIMISNNTFNEDIAFDSQLETTVNSSLSVNIMSFNDNLNDLYMNYTIISSNNFYSELFNVNQTENLYKFSRKYTYSIVIYALRLLIIILPPMLPISLTFTSFYFQYSLKRHNITCINDSKIFIAGQINCIVLDKTGTLTEEGLDLFGFQTTIIKYQLKNKNLIKEEEEKIQKTRIEAEGKPEENVNLNFKLEFDDIEYDSTIMNSILEDFYKGIFNKNYDNQREYDNYKKDYKFNIVYYLECLASCHSIDILNDETFGNSVDKKIFENLNWKIENDQIEFGNEITRYCVYPNNYYKITGENIISNSNSNTTMENSCRYKLIILKRFNFSSKFQSMSVIVLNNLDKSLRYFIKGAPEKIIELCRQESLPNKLQSTLMNYSKSGYRLLATATKIVTATPKEILLSNDEKYRFEKDLVFLGLIVFKNKLKKDTKQIISKLNNSNCKILMATGDNPFTSISVSRECDFIQEKDRVFMVDLERRSNGEYLKVTYVSSDSCKEEDEDEEENMSFSDSSRMSINKKKRRHQKLEERIFNYNQKILYKNNGISDINSILSFLEEIKDSDKDYLCLSGKAFEYIISKFSEETEGKSMVDNQKEDNKKGSIRKIVSKRRSTYNIEHNDIFDEKISSKNDPNTENSVYKRILDIIKYKAKIFFRMTPNNKVLLVNFLKKDKSFIVSMCGDGANDCGALLASDVGISLCSKASNNVTSHFYSKDGSINCIEIIIRNGRACYENMSILYKYMFLYSTIQIASTSFLFLNKERFDNEQYFFFDFVISIISCLLFSKTGPGYELMNSKINRYLINPKFLLSVIGHMLLIFLSTYFTYIILVILNKLYIIEFNQSYIIRDIKFYLFISTSIEYITILIICNMSALHRKKFYLNKLFLIYFSFLLIYIGIIFTNSPIFNKINLFLFTDNSFQDNYFIEVKKIFTLIIVVGYVFSSSLYEIIINRFI